MLAAPQVIIFAGNHGITAQGVSAFPAEVTAQMVMNFQHGGAAINQLSKTFGAAMTVHALALDRPTADFITAPAMDETEVIQALATGWAAVDPAADLLVTGEMGIGNTTVAAALAAALFGGTGADWVGRGTGVDDAGLARKAAVVDAGLALHHAVLTDPLQVMRCLGGRELAAMAGAIAAARHQSAEGAHAKLLSLLGKQPLLSLGLRLGEGSGAALAIGVLRGAIACHSGMVTFAEAGVSGG